MAGKKVGDAGLDWPNLGFAPQAVNGYVQCTWKDEAWSRPRLVGETEIKMSCWANVLHYGQAIFEGQKAFQCKDGKVRVFNDRANYERMTSGCRRMMLPELPWELFQEAIDMAIRENLDFLPPYGSNCSMYLRPLLFGDSAQIQLHPATQAQFLVMVAPVSGYFKGEGGGLQGVVIEDFDRAAPKGVGHVKAAGNYAADMKAAGEGKKKGFALGLYLDPVERRFVEEWNSSNFVAIIGKKYVTPASASILPSVTNQCLMKVADDLGIEVEKRPIDFLQEVETFDEVGAVGTAVVVSPVASITMSDKKWEFKSPDTLQRLANKLRAIQNGEEEDKHGFLREVAV